MYDVMSISRRRNGKSIRQRWEEKEIHNSRRSEGRCWSSVYKLLGVLQNIWSRVHEMQTICEFSNRCESRECIVIGDRRGKCLIFLAFPLLFGLSVLNTTSMFLLVVSIGILLSRIPTIWSRLTILSLFTFIRCMLLLLGGERWISRLGINGG